MNGKPKPVKDEEIEVLLNDLYIFTDGSHSTKTNKTALGIAFSAPYETYNHSELLPPNTTNQLAELYAIAKALEILTQHIQRIHIIVTVEIWTDSDYSVKCVKEWGDKWEENGWKTSENEPVKYQFYIEYIRNTLAELRGVCRLRHLKEIQLKSHQAKPENPIQRMVWSGNKVADDLARAHTL